MELYAPFKSANISDMLLRKKFFFLEKFFSLIRKSCFCFNKDVKIEKVQNKQNIKSGGLWVAELKLIFIFKKKKTFKQEYKVISDMCLKITMVAMKNVL